MSDEDFFMELVKNGLGEREAARLTDRRTAQRGQEEGRKGWASGASRRLCEGHGQRSDCRGGRLEFW
jgi:hypothetical protein